MGWVVNATLRTFYRREKILFSRCTGGWVVPSGRTDMVKIKYLEPTGTRTPDLPFHSKYSMYDENRLF